MQLINFFILVILPLIGIVTGGIDFNNLTVNVGKAVVSYGIFIQSIVDFLIIALSIFIAIRQIDRFKKKKEEIAEEPAPSKEEILLTEIRDELRKR